MANKTIKTTIVCPVCNGRKTMANGDPCLYCGGTGRIEIEVSKNPKKGDKNK